MWIVGMSANWRIIIDANGRIFKESFLLHFNSTITLFYAPLSNPSVLVIIPKGQYVTWYSAEWKNTEIAIG